LHRILVISSKDLSLGFRLSGVETTVAEKAQDAAEALARASESGEYGIIILDGQLAEGFDERTRRRLFGSDVPVVITVPGQMRWQDVEALSTDDVIARLIRQAVGYQLDVQI